MSRQRGYAGWAFATGLGIGAILASTIWYSAMSHAHCEAKGGVRIEGKCIRAELVK
jgi:hypothetical protein